MRNLDADAAVRWLSADMETVVVAGAGLSLDGPTWAPRVADFLEPTLSQISASAGHAFVDAELGERVFPEVIYGAVAEVSHSRDVLKIWETLSESQTTAAGSVPNVGHLALARICSVRGWPLLTTNFDCFLEQAAEALGIPCDIQILEPWDRFSSYRSARGRLLLIKVHGTAEDWKTIKSTASDLSQSARALEGMALTPPPRRVLVIGYSGRDFDLFPTIISQFSRDAVLWIDPKFPLNHRAYALDSLCYSGYWRNIAAMLALPLSPIRDEKAVKEYYRKAINDRLKRHLMPALSPPGGAVAVLTGICAAAGAHVDAAALAARWREIAEPRARIQTLLWGAHACSSLDRFDTARMYARQAKQEARASASRPSRGRAAIAATYAATSNLWMNVVPAASTDRWFRLRRWAVLARVVWTALVWAPLAITLIRRLTPRRGIDSADLSIDKYRFCADYLEHLIRLMSFANTLAQSRAILIAPVRAGWRLISRACSSIGYTWGVFNVSKYTSRTDGDFRGPRGALTTADVIGDRVGACIAHRDAARSALAEAATVPDPTMKLRTARRELDLAKEQADELQCPSLIFKIALVARSLDPAAVLPRPEVDRLLKLTQCDALDRQASEIRRLLCS